MTVPVTKVAGFGGQIRYQVTCPVCAATRWGVTPDDARDRLATHQAIPAPPADVMARPLTKAIVDQYADYYISGCGRVFASQTDCSHGYYLTDSCPCCP